MRDIGHEETDKLIEQLEKKITREYSQAVREMSGKIDDYMRRFQIKDDAWQKMVANGEKTAEEYRKWRTAQMMYGQNWKELANILAEDMYSTNAIARGMVVGDMTKVYAENFNWATFQIEHDAKVNTGFTLYNHEAVENLLKNDPELLKPPGKQMKQTFAEWDAYTSGKNVNLTPEKQKAFDKLIAKGKDIRWQEGQIQSITLQSILQGESIPNMTKRIAETLGEINHKSTIRYARTAMTSAQEQGRAHAYQRAEDMGVDLKREWRAVFDMRTRHAHRQLDGQLRGIDEPFEVDGEEIMFPGDPAAAGYLIYNCRCRTTAAVKGWDKQSRQLRSDEAVGGMSYDEWKKGHSISQPITKQEDIANIMRQKTIRELYKGKPGAPTTNVQTAKQKAKQKPKTEAKTAQTAVERPKNEQDALKQFNYVGKQSREEILSKTNPKFSSGDRNYRINCQRTVVAQELRCRGYDVTARPRANDAIGSNGVCTWKTTSPWYNDPGLKVPGLRSNFKQTAKDAFDEWGDGSRAIVRVQWQRKYGGSGHFFFAERVGDDIIYSDPQIGKLRDIDETLSLCTTSRNSLWIMRVDNRDVTDLVGLAVENVGG